MSAIQPRRFAPTADIRKAPFLTDKAAKITDTATLLLTDNATLLIDCVAFLINIVAFLIDIAGLLMRIAGLLIDIVGFLIESVAFLTDIVVFLIDIATPLTDKTAPLIDKTTDLMRKIAVLMRKAPRSVRKTTLEQLSIRTELQATPTNVVLRQGVMSGFCVARYRTPRNRSVNEASVCTSDPNVESNWNAAGIFDSGKATLTGCTPGSSVWTRSLTLSYFLESWIDNPHEK